MKTLLLISLLSTSAFAYDNCYLFQRGSEDWMACKEQAADQQKAMDRLDADAQRYEADSQATRAATAQNETNRLLQQINSAEQKRTYVEGQ